MFRKRPRLHPSLYVGRQRYFLTFCSSDRRRVFITADVVNPVRDQFLQTATEFDVAVHAYCFMPDHLHLLAEGVTECADAVAFVHQGKQRTGFAFTRSRGARLWQPSFYDRVLRDDEATLAVARYIFENPIRAGLVGSVAEYPFLGSDTFTIDQILEASSWQP